MPARKPIGAVISARDRDDDQPVEDRLLAAERPEADDEPEADRRRRARVIHGRGSSPARGQRRQPVGGGWAVRAGFARRARSRGGQIIRVLPARLLLLLTRAHTSKAAGFITITGARISACPSPQSSVQMTVYLPGLGGRDRQVRDDPGHGVLLLPELRDPEGVDDVERAQGELHLPALDEPKLMRLEAAVLRVLEVSRRTAARSRRPLGGSTSASPFSASATALRTAISVTSTVGIAVQTISSPVCPWNGWPVGVVVRADAELDDRVDR